MRKCPSCGEEVSGRTDKKFCSHYCKSSYHYIKNREDESNLFNKIDKQLRRNRRILKEYNRAGKATVRRDVLLKEGFDPSYFTHYWKNKKGDVYFFCYEFGFLKTTEHSRDKFILVQWQKYMDKS